MTARLTANLVLTLALGAVAAGCTVHTYSARPEYPSAAFTHSEPTRREVSFRSERRSHDRDSDRPEAYTPTHRPSAHRPRTTRPDNDRPAYVATRDRETTENVRNTLPRSQAGSSSTRDTGTAQKPRVEKKDGEHVSLLPAKPEKAKPKPKRRPLSFKERLELLVMQKNQEVAQQEKERRARINAIGTAAVKND
jgi:hypothetical protein